MARLNITRRSVPRASFGTGGRGKGGQSPQEIFIGTRAKEVARQPFTIAKEQRGQEQAIATSLRKPGLAAETKRQVTEVERGPEREILVQNMIRLKGLFDQTPRTKPGPLRFLGVGRNLLQKQFQKSGGVQSDQFDDVKQAIAGNLVRVIGGETGARLSDFDIKRVINAVPDIIGDTDDRGLLGWATLGDIIDDTLKAYGVDSIDATNNFLPDEARRGRARALQGNFSFSEFSDAELLGAVAGDVNAFNEVTQELLLNELITRGLDGGGQ